MRCASKWWHRCCGGAITQVRPPRLPASHTWRLLARPCRTPVSFPLAVTTYNTAAEALQILRERTSDFDLVLSDVYMPGVHDASWWDSGVRALALLPCVLGLLVAAVACCSRRADCCRGASLLWQGLLLTCLPRRM